MELYHRFVKPRYDSYGFSSIPRIIKTVLAGDGAPSQSLEVLGDLPRKYDTVALFLIDAFGWRFYEQFADKYPILKRFQAEGTVAKLFSQFPSTTASHITTIHTDLTVGRSGIYEWQYYEPQLDAIITPLLFSYAGSRKRERLKSQKIDPRRIFPNQTFYQKLASSGIESHIFQDRAYTPASFGDVVFQGANVHAYSTLPEVMVNLGLLLEQKRPPTYVFVYFDRIDEIGHIYGPDSPQVEAEIDIFLTALERLLFNSASFGNGRTLLMVTADHGMTRVDPKTTIYLNLDKRFDGIKQLIKRNRSRKPLAPAGSCRDMFLYIKPDRLEEALEFLRERLTGVADVHLTGDLIEEGMFGPEPPSEAFLGRVGDLVILPYENQSVWWYVKGKFEQRFSGHHGGLTRSEMEIPLLLYSF